MGWFLPCLFSVTLMVGAVYGVGTAITSAVGRKSEYHRRRGRYVLNWTTAGAASGGMVALFKVDASNAFYFGEFGGSFIGLGIIAGVLVGNVHGFFGSGRTPDQS